MVDLSRLEDELTKYNPGGFPKTPSINAVPPPTPQGSVLGAVFAQEHTIGSIINKFSQPMPAGPAQPDFSPIKYIPPQLYDYADRFAALVNEDQVNWMADQINKEIRDKAIIAASPWRSFGAGIAVSLVDLPGYILPGGAIYSNATRGLNIARSALSVAGANALSSVITESVLHQTQYARRADESIMNVFGSALVGAGLGVVGATVVPRSIAKGAAGEASDILSNGRPSRRPPPDNGGPSGPSGGGPSTSPGQGGATVEGQIVPVESPFTMKEQPTIKPGENPNLPVIYSNPLVNADYLRDSRGLANLAGIEKLNKITPYMRLKQSEFGYSRAIADELLESQLGTLSTDVGLMAAPRNLETRTKRAHWQYMYHTLEYQDIFFAQRGLDGGMLKRTGAYMTALVKNENLPGLDWPTFNIQVSQELRYPLSIANPDVQRAARLIETKIIKPIRDALIQLELLPANVNVSTANGYLMRRWNTARIIEDQAGFDSMLTIYYTKVNDALITTLPLVKKIETSLARAHKILPKLTGNDKALVEEGIRILTETIEGLKNQEIMGQKAAHLLDTDGNWRAIQNADELRANVIRTRQNILSLGDERLGNPILRGVKEGTPSPLMSRDLLVPDDHAFNYLINDASMLTESYIKSLSPVIEITKFARERGYEGIGNARGAMKQLVRDEWEARSHGKTGKEAVDLKKQLDNDIRDIDATFDMLLGIYGPPTNRDDFFANAMRSFLKYNQIRLMGSMTLSALPDIGLIAMRYGPYELVHSGILPLLRSKALRDMTKEDLKALGFAINTEIGVRLKSYADTADLVVSRGRFGRAADNIMQGFGNVVLFNQWNDMAQELAGGLAYNFYFSRIDAFMKTGKISDIDMRRMARAGISREDFGYYHAQWLKFGGIDEGAYYGSMGAWEIKNPKEAAAFERLQEAIIKEVHNTVVEPTLADKPLFTHTLPGKVATQFKSFGFAATNKIFMSAVQNRDDQHAIAGLVTLLSLGAFAYTVTSLIRGQEPDLSFAHLSKEAVDRSGILGIFSEYYNIANKAGIIPGQGVSRYKSRGIWGALGGPTVGAVEDIAAVLAKITQANGGKPLTTKDVDALLRLMPYQNLFYAHQLSRAVARKAAVAVGIQEVPETKRSKR